MSRRSWGIDVPEPSLVESRKQVWDLRLHRGWVIAAVAVIAVSIGFVALTSTNPAYDAFGWLTWGRQTLHWNLNTDGAPSWKPVTYLFSLIYALAGRTQMSLWVLTSVAAAFSASVFAGRIAFRLTARDGGHRLAAAVAAAFAGIGMLGIGDYFHLVLITSSDPLIMTLCLAAIDSHLSGRPRLALLCLVLAALGRPEVWPFLGLYALWAWRAHPEMRWWAVAGVVSIPVLWFSIPAITSKSWFIAGDLALGAKTVIHGNKVIGVLDRFHELYGWQMELGALVALAIAARRRDRVPLVLGGLAVLWIAIETALALHGYSAVPRYLIEPAAVMVVLAALAVGQLLVYAGRWPHVFRWAGPVLALALVGTLIPYGVRHERTVRGEVSLQQGYHRQLTRLEAVIKRLGGAATIKACGHPVISVGYQSTLAWELGLNVGKVGYKPGREIRRGRPVVVFNQHRLGWRVRTYHLTKPVPSRCARLRTNTPFS